jgi:hypothetical protein
VGEIDAGSLEEAAVLDQAGDTAAAFGPGPFVAEKRMAVDFRQARDDGVLQAEEKRFTPRRPWIAD